MSVEAMAVVLHHSRAKGTAKLILLGIANHDGDGGAWPSIATLAKYANVTDRNAAKAVQQLRGMAEISVDVQAGGTPNALDSRRPNLYRVLVMCPPWCDRTSQHRDMRVGEQSALWKTPPSQTTPPVANDGGPPSETTPHPPSLATGKPSIEPSNNVVVLPQVTTEGGAHPSLERCGICSRTRFECIRYSAAHDMGHLFEPTRRTR